MRAVHDGVLLLPGVLLPQADPLSAVFDVLHCGRVLLPQADAVCPLPEAKLLSRRLLPQAASGPVLPARCPVWEVLLDGLGGPISKPRRDATPLVLCHNSILG